jgi:peptide/nickel transport system permease protein
MLEIESSPPGFDITILKILRPGVEDVSLLHIMVEGRPQHFTEIPLESWTFRGDSLIYLPYNSEEKEALALPQITHGAMQGTIRQDGDHIFFRDQDGKAHRRSLADLRNEITKENIVHRTYWLGTDRFGRDMLSRLLLGARVSLSVGLVSVMISLVTGITLGLLAGYFGGWVDMLIQWIINVVWSIPTFLLVMAIALVLGRGFWQVFLAIGLTMWVDVARMVRGQILGVRELEYVQAARALGYRAPRIMFRHILPNITGPVMVLASANFATAILLEAGLSFLGLGVQPPTPSWGVMINDSYTYIVLGSAYLALLPGVAIMLLVLAFNMLGNGLLDALDVRG